MNNLSNKKNDGGCISSTEDVVQTLFSQDDEDSVGFGAFGTVYKTKIESESHLYNFLNDNKLANIENLIDQDIAIKKIKINSNNNFNEIKILIKTKDLEFSCKYYCCIITEKNVYIIMEYINGILLDEYQDEIKNIQPNIFNLIKQGNIMIDEQKKRIQTYLNNVNTIIIQLAQAIDELHKKKIYHNDIKLENIMVITDEDDIYKIKKIKLFDYGAGCNYNENITDQKDCGLARGSSGYLIKEFIIENSKINKINKNSRIYKLNYEQKIAKKDWWAFGFTLFALLFYEFPESPYDNKASLDIAVVNKLIENLTKIKSEDSLTTDITAQRFYELLTYLITNKETNILKDNKTAKTIQEEIFRILDIKKKAHTFTNATIVIEENLGGGGRKKNKTSLKVNSKLKLQSKRKRKLKTKRKLA